MFELNGFLPIITNNQEIILNLKWIMKLNNVLSLTARLINFKVILHTTGILSLNIRALAVDMCICLNT